jgi:hypothetical protein
LISSCICFSQALVQGAERLVHQHELGVENQRAGQRHALLLAARQLPWPPVRQGFHLDHAQRRPHALARVRLVDLANGQREGDILLDRQMRKQGIVLKYHSDVALMRRHVLDRTVGEVDLALSRNLEARQHHQRGRLARA